MKRLLLALPGVLMALHPVQSAIVLNEVHLNPPNADGLGDRNFEYMELRSFDAASFLPTSESTDDLTILIVNNDRWDFQDNGQGEVATNLNMGEVEEVWSLAELKTGPNGLLLLGDKYAELPKGGPWAGFLDPATEVGDPVGMGDGNIGSNDGLSIFLVRNFKNPAPNNNGVLDFDVNENGILDWRELPVPANGLQAPPWDSIVDQIGTRDRNEAPWPFPPAAPDLVGIAEPYTGAANGANANLNVLFTGASIGDRDPDSFSRNANLLTASLASQWYGGKFADPLPGSDPATSIAYRTNRVFGIANGQATPGRANLSADPGAADFRINEVNLDPQTDPSDRDRFQYVEIVNINSPPGSRSLAGWWLVMVDSNVSATDAGPPVPLNIVGTVMEEWDLSAMATGTDGKLLIADEASSSFTAFEDYVPIQAGKGDPVASTSNPKSTGLGMGDLGSKSGFSLFLIRNYKTAAADLALSTTRDLDSNDDGILNSAAFGAGVVVDSVGFDQDFGAFGPPAGVPAGAGKTYATTNLRTVFPAYVGADANKAPDNFGRKVSGGLPVTANDPSSWSGGEFSSGAGFNLGFQTPLNELIIPPNPNIPGDLGNPTGATHFGGFRGAATPGRTNLSGPINSAAPPIDARIRINEVMFDGTNTAAGNTDLDQNRDYIELLSDNHALAYLDGFWIMVIDNSGNNTGVVKNGAPLDGSTTGLNGILLIGDNYDTTVSPYESVEGTLPPSTAALDPAVAFGANAIPGNGATVLLIRGPAYDPATPNGPFKTGGPITVTNLKPSGDIDPNNDGVLLPSTDWLAPGSVLVDAISIGAIDPGPEYGHINGNGWLPDCAARKFGNFSSASASAWYFGQVNQEPSTVPSTAFTTSAGESFQGHASPGRLNHTAAVPTAPFPPTPIPIGSLLINEFHFNPAGGDGNFEFIEIMDTSGTSRSLNGYSLVMFDNVKNNTGTIQRAWSLDGAKTGTNGLLFITNGTRDTSPWKDVIPAATEVFDPPGRNDLVTGFGDATLGAESDNQSVFLMLVRNFNTTIGTDLDEFAAGAPSGGDGALEATGISWEGGLVHDSVSLRSFLLVDPGPPAGPKWNGFIYSSTGGSPPAPILLADLSSVFFPNPIALNYHPETVARFRGNVTPNSNTAWYGGDLTGGPSGKLGTDTTYVTNDPTHPPVSGLATPFTGRTTPGQPNLATNESVSTGYDAWAAGFPGIGGPSEDADKDTFSNLLEYAGGSIPNNGGSLPQSTQTLTPPTPPTAPAVLTVSWAKGAQAAADPKLSWSIESSTSLAAGWSTSTVVAQNGPTSISAEVTILPDTPKTFLRLKVVRTP